MVFLPLVEFVFARSPAGHVPAELQNVAALESLYLAGNKLSGESRNELFVLDRCSRPPTRRLC